MFDRTTSRNLFAPSLSASLNAEGPPRTQRKNEAPRSKALEVSLRNSSKPFEPSLAKATEGSPHLHPRSKLRGHSAKENKYLLYSPNLARPSDFCSGHALRPFDVAQGMLCGSHLFSDSMQIDLARTSPALCIIVPCRKPHRAGASVAPGARPGRESLYKGEPQARTR